MKRWGLAATTALVGVLGGAVADAQVTPEEVWQNWQKLTASYGQALVADSVAREGDTLVAKGVKTTMEQDGASMTGAVDEMRFRDLGDGSVEVTASDTYTMKMVIPEDGKTNALNATLLQPDLRVVASGTAGSTSYAYEVPNATLTMQALEDGKTQADIRAEFTGTTGSYLVKTEGEKTVAESTIDVRTLAFSVTGGDAAGTFDATGNIAGLKFSGGGTFLGIAAMEDMAKALADGVNLNVAASYGAGSFEIDATEGGKATRITAMNETGHFNFALSGEELRYGAGGTGVSMTLSGAEIPFPEVKLSYGEAAFDFVVPVAKSDAPRDFSVVTRIVDLAVSEEIWGMLDPTGTLPHDPATLILDTKGKARLTTDLFDEAGMAALGEAPPGELHALTVTDLTGRVAGAELTGKGDFTFDNSDLVTFGGFPAPTGRLDLVLKGGNGLLDKLVAMGLVPSEDAMGFRMMLAMFAKPGEGEDVLNSTLEFKDKGFFANGQRLQ